MAVRTRAELGSDVATINDGGANTPLEVRTLVQNVIDSGAVKTIETVDPSAAPDAVGDKYINTVTGALFEAIGTATVNDWVEIALFDTGGNLTSFTGLVGANGGAAQDVNTKALLLARIGDLASIQEEPAEGPFADGDKTKLDWITVTQAVDLDAIETRVNALDAAVILMGTFDASLGSFPGGGTAQAGESWIVSTGGTIDGVVFTANDRIVAITDNASTTTYAANWHKLDYTDAVLSVNGGTGAVDLSGTYQPLSGDLTTYAANPLTAAELQQLQNIGAATISAAQWGYLGAATAFAGDLLDDADAGTARATLEAAALGANTFTGAQNFNGQQVEGMLNKVVTGVTGALTAAAHSGNILATTGNVTIPTTAGFSCVLIAGGAHTVTFNGATSAAMAAGDIMTIMVESGTVIHAVLTAAADKVSFV